MIRNVRDRYVREGKESDEEIYEPVTWPPKRRSEPAPEPRRERPDRRENAPRRKREKTPA